MPSGRTSAASASDRPSRANFVALYAPKPGIEPCPPTLLSCTIAPERRARMWGSTARVRAAGPKRCTSKSERSSSSAVSSTEPTWVRPALLTRTSTRPWRSTTSATTRSIAAVSVTSRATGSTWSGWAATRSSRADTRRAAATTTSPAATAASVKARPKPLLAPVISQTLLMGSFQIGRAHV